MSSLASREIVEGDPTIKTPLVSNQVSSLASRESVGGLTSAVSGVVSNQVSSLASREHDCYPG